MIFLHTPQACASEWGFYERLIYSLSMGAYNILKVNEQCLNCAISFTMNIQFKLEILGSTIMILEKR